MLITHGFAARKVSGSFEPFTFERRDPGANDVVIDVLYCGICHSDIHTVRDEWGGVQYPVVPGHEILGRVSQAGRNVSGFKAGDLAGVGCFVSSCRTCAACRRGEEQFCPGIVFTYNGTGGDSKNHLTYGGYADRIVVDHRYVFRLQSGQPLARVAPLLCAGITTYSPLKRAGVKRGTRVGIVGLGGLGHIAVKIAASMGAEVTVFTTSQDKVRDARRLGARFVVVTKKPKAFASLAGRFDLILDTVSEKHDLAPYLASLKDGGAMTLVGAPEKPFELSSFSLIMGRKTLGGSLIGGVIETQEMLDYCASQGILADVEVISPSQIDRAYDRAVAGKVKYRFVIDLKTGNSGKKLSRK